MQPKFFHDGKAANLGIFRHVVGQVEQFVVGVISQGHREEQIADIGGYPGSKQNRH